MYDGQQIEQYIESVSRPKVLESLASYFWMSKDEDEANDHIQKHTGNA